MKLVNPDEKVGEIFLLSVLLVFSNWVLKETVFYT